MTGHAIEGIGYKHAIWIHNVHNMDWLICIDDQQCLKGLQLLQEGMPYNRTRWHHQKYYTWVEQQGKTVEELRALADPDFWLKEQAKTADIDKKLARARGF